MRPSTLALIVYVVVGFIASAALAFYAYVVVHFAMKYW